MKKKQKNQKRKTNHKVRGGLLPEQYLCEAEQKKLIRYVKNQADLARIRGSKRAIIDEMIILLFLNTGLRAGELSELRIADVPPANGKDVIVIRQGKGKVTRSIVIGKRMQDRINRFIQLYRKKAKSNDTLLVNERGTQLIYFSIWSKLRRIGKEIGFSRLNPHRLRHTYLTRLYNIEHDLRFVQDQAGHADPKTTAIYAHTDQKSQRRQIESLEKLDLTN